jgi:hypothetical protein
MKSFINSIDVSTRGKRRKAIYLVIELLEKIRNAEERYLERIPLNLQSSSAYSSADESIYTIINAIIGLVDAY